MNTYQNFLIFDCQVFNLNNVTEELFNLREKFCPSKGSIKCNPCPIYLNYRHLGLSCNQALNEYPEECKKIMQGDNNKWYVITDTMSDNILYVGINDDSYYGDGQIISEHNNL